MRNKTGRAKIVNQAVYKSSPGIVTPKTLIALLKSAYSERLETINEL